VQERLDAVIASLEPGVKASSVRLAVDPADQLGQHRTVQCPVIVIPRGVDASLASLFTTSQANVA
jgi:hypothetical protein